VREADCVEVEQYKRAEGLSLELIDNEKVASFRSAPTDVTSRSLPSPIRIAAMPEALAKPCSWTSGARDMKASSGAELSEKRRPETVNRVLGERSKKRRSLSSTSIWSYPISNGV
jgi:hypothetical protein